MFQGFISKVRLCKAYKAALKLCCQNFYEYPKKLKSLSENCLHSVFWQCSFLKVVISICGTVD